MIARADLQGWVCIADYVQSKTGLTFGWETARKHARKVRDRLVVYRAGRRVYARFADLDQFAASYVRQIDQLNGDAIPINPT